ncbi:MAG: ribosomal-processing cysteine protease Prp [Clostridiales bacterium]|nr:ribosomal-processing cysteine protease Prp [Clostridiales bacterium]
MIHVTVFVDSSRYVGITMSGHAGRADHPQEGQELVCAAASALALNMANCVEHFTDDRFEAEVGENDGYFHFAFTGYFGKESALLMNSLIFGLQDLEDSYGEPYIQIRFQEV